MLNDPARTSIFLEPPALNDLDRRRSIVRRLVCRAPLRGSNGTRFEPPEPLIVEVLNAPVPLSAPDPMVIDGETVEASFAQAAGNLRAINVLPAMGANVYDILNHETPVLTPAAVEKLEARING